MNMQEAVRSVLSQYATFSGRARRSEYWFFYLAVIIATVIAAILDLIIDSEVLEWIVFAVTIVPNLAVGSRRMHDIGKSGWAQLICIIPIVGWILIIVWFCRDGDPRQNEYGPSPKGMGAWETPPKTL